jgi:hypothetical protein
MEARGDGRRDVVTFAGVAKAAGIWNWLVHPRGVREPIEAARKKSASRIPAIDAFSATYRSRYVITRRAAGWTWRRTGVKPLVLQP